MDAQFYSLQTILERCIQHVYPWLGLQKIIDAIAEENNQ